jgi:lipopolysaccharide biosynthesis glycosyltransferase
VTGRRANQSGILLSVLRIGLIQQKPIYCFGIDDNYAWPLLITLYSAKKNHKKFKKAYILYDPEHLKDEMIFYINAKSKLLGVKLKFIPLHLTSHSEVQAHITSTSYLRFQIPKVSRKKAFWFDTDVLFLGGWHQISEYAVSNKSDIEPIFARLHWPHHESESNQAMINSKGRYFNAGVLLVNSKVWRRERIMQNLIAIMPNYTQYGFEWADQCVLNYYFAGEYSQIDLRYNSIPKEFKVNQTRILHFAGLHKPWTFKIDAKYKLVELENDLEIADLLPEERSAWQTYRETEQELINLLAHKR